MKDLSHCMKPDRPHAMTFVAPEGCEEVVITSVCGVPVSMSPLKPGKMLRIEVTEPTKTAAPFSMEWIEH